MCVCNLQWRRPGAEFGGDGKIFRGPRFLNDISFGKKFHNSVFRAKITDDLFLVTDQVFRIFPFFFQIFRILTMLNVVYDPFLTRKAPFLLCSYFRTHIRQHYISKVRLNHCKIYYYSF